MFKRLLSIFATRAPEAEKRELYHGPLSSLFSTNRSSAGASVDKDSILTVSAAYAAVRVLAETVSTLPLFLYIRDEEGNRKVADGNPIFALFHRSPNKDMTPVQLLDAMMTNIVTQGNSFVQIIRKRNGHIDSLYPLLSDCMQVKADDNGNVVYVYRGKTILSPDEVIHIPGLSYNGFIGFSPLTVARQVLGLGIALDEHSSVFFNNSSIPAGVLEVDGSLSENAAIKLRNAWENNYGGSGSAHRTAILEGGASFKPIAFNAQDSQLLESRKFQVNEIARIFRVPLHMIQDLDRATFSNIESQSIDFVRHTIRPWLVRIEQGLNKALLGSNPKLFFEFKVDALLRGDTQTRYEAYAKGIQNGFLTPNEVRKLENLNTVGQKAGDVFLRPLNMIQVSPEGEILHDGQQKPEAPAPVTSNLEVPKEKARSAYKEIALRAASEADMKFLRKVNKWVETQPLTDLDQFKGDLQSFVTSPNMTRQMTLEFEPFVKDSPHFNLESYQNDLIAKLKTIVDDAAPGEERSSINHALTNPDALVQLTKYLNPDEQ